MKILYSLNHKNKPILSAYFYIYQSKLGFQLISILNL